MDIEFTGYGFFYIKESDYNELVEIIGIDMDILLDCVGISKIGSCPILGINIEK